MDTHKTRYCNSSGFIIKNDRAKHDIIQGLEDQVGYNPLNLFEKSYSDRLKDTLKDKDIVATYISLGKYAYMYLTRIYNENVALIIEMDSNSNNSYPKIISVPCSFNDEIYDGTLLYGEVYRSYSKKWYFLCERAILSYGTNSPTNTLKNIEVMNKIFDQKYSFTPISPFIIQQKAYFNLNDIGESIDKLKESRIPIKGIKFYGLKVAMNYYFNTNHYNKNDYEFKKLPQLKNLDVDKDKKLLIREMQNEMIHTDNIIFDIGSYVPKLFYLEMRKTPTYGIYDLYARTNDKYGLKKVGTARIVMMEMSSQIIIDTRKVFIVTCKYDYLFKKFNIIHINKGIITLYDDVIDEINLTSKFPIPNYAE